MQGCDQLSFDVDDSCHQSYGFAFAQAKQTKSTVVIAYGCKLKVLLGNLTACAELGFMTAAYIPELFKSSCISASMKPRARDTHGPADRTRVFSILFLSTGYLRTFEFRHCGVVLCRNAVAT